ncbi:MAG: hypothetical protein A2283_05490 [Lentisphaerae bacterium RIFOXYA12_FULL_48_11]|nr:MAG: hypothetical protein A2283_05490 [Lentisphaerae bacterium RIFOXYA12_FULL_48_11]
MARILLVDDEQGILNTLTILLKSEGFEPAAALGAEKALQILMEEEFDLMISDIRMAPMNGMELLRIVHETYPNMAVIMLTAYGQVDSAIEADQLGASAYVKKPFRTEELLMAIEKALDYRKLLSDQANNYNG